MNIKRLREENDGFLPHYAWPGGYAIAYYTQRGDVLCPDCAELDGSADDPIIAADTSDYFNDRPLEEMDDTSQDERCENCNMRIGVGPLDEEAPEEDKHPYVYVVYVLDSPRCKNWYLLNDVPENRYNPYDRRAHHRYSYENAVTYARKFVASQAEEHPRMKFQVVREKRQYVALLQWKMTKAAFQEQMWWKFVPEEEAGLRSAQ